MKHVAVANLIKLMKRINLERIALTLGLDAAAIAAMSFSDLKEAVAAAKRSQVPAGTAEEDEDDAYEAIIAEMLTNEGITFVIGNAAEMFDELVETIDSQKEPKRVGKNPLAFNYKNKAGEFVEFILAEKRNERSRKAVVKFIGFEALGEATNAKGEKYTKLLATAVVFDAAGNGEQNNYAVNSSLIAALTENGLFKGINMPGGVPDLKGKELYALVQLSENEGGVTTWGIDDATIIAQAVENGTAVYSEKGKRYAAVYDRENSKQESLDKIVGIVDAATVKRLQEKQLTSLEMEGARLEQAKLIDLKFKAVSIESSAKNAKATAEAISAYTALGFTFDQAVKLVMG